MYLLGFWRKIFVMQNNFWNKIKRMQWFSMQTQLSKRFDRGFTLIELLVAVAIIGILSSIVVPQFRNSMEKAKMSEAKTVLAAIRTGEGIYFLENDEYTLTLADLDVEIGASTLFTYAVTVVADPIITATRTGGSFDTDQIQMDMDGQLSYSADYIPLAPAGAATIA